MGLGSWDLLDDGDGGGCKATASPVSCSICLEAVVDVGDRSWAKLQCGHRFHLDCIGSAFNAKGAMQCPNCRKIEKGQWLYANGCRPVSEFNMEDWAHDEDLNDLSSYAEMSFWCPFGGLASLPSILDEAEFSPAPSHPCPYFAYVAPIHSSSSGSISDGSSFGNHWTGPGESLNAYPFPSMEPHYRAWDQFFASNLQASGVDQSPISPATQRPARNGSETMRPGGMHPFVVGHSSAVRGANAARTSSLHHPPFPVARPRDRFQHAPRPAANPVVPATSSGRRSNGSHHHHHHRMTMSSGGAAAAAHQGSSTAASSSDQSAALYLFSSGRVYQEVDRNHRFHGHSSPMWMLPPPQQFQQPSSGDSHRQRSSSSQYHHHQS